MAQPILQYREAEVARGGEHGRARDPDLEAVQVIAVNLEREAEDEVVDQRQQSRRRYPVCRNLINKITRRKKKGEPTIGKHVRHHTNLIMHRRSRPQKDPQLLRDRALAPPRRERVEDQLVASIRVLLPPVQLVVARKRHALFEPAERVRRPADDVPFQLISSSLFFFQKKNKQHTCNLKAISKSSETFDSDQIFRFPSRGSTNAASWSADHRKNALCPTNGATSPFAVPIEMHLLIRRVKCAIPFSK